jgi:hypothetical protein
MTSFPRATLALGLALALGAAACACGSDGGRDGGVIIEPLTSPTAATTARAVPTGGKPAAPARTATADAPIEQPTQSQAATATSQPPAATVEAPPGPPASGRWIEVDVTNLVVRLMDGQSVVREIAPVGVGVQVDTGAYLSTQTGLFHVNSKTADLVYDAPYDTYISHWVGFDAEKDNGFHSFLKDASGNVVDASTGRVSNGCIRTGEPEAVFAFAEIGMPVWVHT